MDITREADIAALLPSWHDFTAAALPGSGYGVHRLRFSSSPDPDTDCLNLAAFTGQETGSAAGFISIRLGTKANLDQGTVQIFLRADQTDTTVADALLAAAKERMVSQGRTRIHLNLAVPAPTTAYASLFTPAASFTAVGFGLDLSAVDRRQFAEWAGPSAGNQDYQIVHWIDRCPDELAESYSACLNALYDAPEEELELEHPRRDVVTLRQGEALTISHGVRRHVAVALSAQGEVAGFTQSVWFPEEPAIVDLWSTAVAREHRGHGLGLRIKAAATLNLIQGNPAAALVLTYNNHGNDHMVAVNEKLGYKPLHKGEVHEIAC